MSRDIESSRRIVKILRHGAHSEGLQPRSDGFMLVEHLLTDSQLQRLGVTSADVERIVATDNKKRYQLDRSGKLKVKATQGHSLQLENLNDGMEEIKLGSHTFPSKVVHGTSSGAWDQIQSEGLSRMKRQHIHFAIGEPGDRAVTSGMPLGSQIMIYIDAEAAIRDGIKFYRSANNVILSSGNERGVIPPRYFKEVYTRNPNERAVLAVLLKTQVVCHAAKTIISRNGKLMTD